VYQHDFATLFSNSYENSFEKTADGISKVQAQTIDIKDSIFITNAFNAAKKKKGVVFTRESKRRLVPTLQQNVNIPT